LAPCVLRHLRLLSLLLTRSSNCDFSRKISPTGLLGAQKSKTASTDKSQPAPKRQSPNDSQEGGQRGRIRVSVNLVNVLSACSTSTTGRQRICRANPSNSSRKESSRKIEGLRVRNAVTATTRSYDRFEFERRTRKLSSSREAAGHFISQVLRPGDRLAVFAVGSRVFTELAGFSDNVATLQAASARMPADAGTSIYDAIRSGLSLPGAPAVKIAARVMILVTDAGETTSRADFDAARKEAVRSGSPALHHRHSPRSKTKAAATRPANTPWKQLPIPWVGLCSSRTPPANWTVFSIHQPRAAYAIPAGLLSHAARTCQYLSGNRSQSGPANIRFATASPTYRPTISFEGNVPRRGPQDAAGDVRGDAGKWRGVWTTPPGVLYRCETTRGYEKRVL